MIIGLTGGIGSGKSAALDILGKAGYNTFSCDKEVAALYKKQRVLRRLKREFPNGISGRLILKADKKAIAETVFSDREKYEFLTDYLAKRAFISALKKAKKAKGDSVIETPLLLEYDLAGAFDKVIVIVRDLGERIKSVTQRDGITEKQITDRINRQFDYENADLSQYTVVKNDGDLSSLKEKILTAVK